ncbi:MAG: hypothetical protein IIT76_13600 [Prevotella sp.]|nr:hypothetical protein [Prevotella sp.]MBQ5548883.1 hypothetical protein [Prevotella sp.]
MKRLHRHALTIGQRTVYTLLACLLVSAGWSEELDTLRFEYQPEKDIKELNLPKMYKLVDDALEESGRYIADYESKLYKTKQAIAESSDDHQKLTLTLDLSLMYESFNGDSTLAYTARALQMAGELGLPEVVADCQARMAYLCTFLGSQTESLTLLQRIDKSALTQDGLCNYYRSYMMVYGNLGGNCQIPAMREEFYQKHLTYMDSLLATAKPGSEMYLGHRQPQLVGEKRFEEALKMNDERLNMTQEGTHDNAIVSYSRYTIYNAMGNRDMAKYWLCKSALDDIRNAVMDQTSLISLAEMLDEDGDLERANRYIGFTWECNRRFSPHMRLWQMAPLLSAIEENFEAKLNRKSQILTVTTIAASILLVVLLSFAIHFRRKRKELIRAKAELEQTNRRLAGVNEILRIMKHQPEA